MKFAVIDNTTREIENIVKLLAGSIWTPDANKSILDVTDFPDIEIGMSESVWSTVIDGSYVKPVVPEEVILADISPRQVRLALTLSGISLSQIDTFLDSMNEPDKSLAKIEWEYAQSFKRDNTLVNQMAALMGLTSQQVDDLWTLGFSL
jgi:hypothetical protein